MKKYLLALLLILSCVAYAQTPNRVRIRVGQIEIPKGFDTLNTANKTLYTNLQLGSQENDMDNYAKAAEYFKAACVAEEKATDKNVELLSNCYYYLGVVCVNGSDNKSAEACFKKSYAIREKSLGQNDAKTTQCLTMLGLVCINKQDFDGALTYFNQALPIYQSSTSKNDLKAATCHEYMGVVYEGKKQYDEAIRNYNSALQLYKSAYGADHLSISGCLFKIGMLYSKKQQYTQSIDYITQALTLREKLLPKNDMSTAECYYQLGVINYQLGKEPEAIHNFQTTYSIYKQRDMENNRVSIQSLTYLLQMALSHGKQKESLYYSSLLVSAKDQNRFIDSLDMAETYANHGVLLAKNKKFDYALAYLNKALSIRSAKLGNAEKTGNVCYNLAFTYFRVGDYPNAIKSYIKAIDIFKEKETNQSLLKELYYQLGNAYVENAEYDKALDCATKILPADRVGKETNKVVLQHYYSLTCEANCYEGKYAQATQSAQKGLGLADGKRVNYVSAVGFYNNLGEIYKDKGDYKKAEEQLMKAAAVFYLSPEKDSLLMAPVYGNLGAVYREIGNNKKSQEYLNRALSLDLKEYGVSHVFTSVIYNQLGVTYQMQGDTTNALGCLNKALAARDTVLRKDHPKLAETYMALGNLYVAKGDNDKAIAYYQKMLAITEKTLEPGAASLKKTYKIMGECYLAKGDKAQADMYLAKSK
ncbi:MAG: tetratricopeptide repeat protein [Paludibacteraceae bacterium]|nr:tetratricopeptide repeat protein [Paludibacteraceae bacterium]